MPERTYSKGGEHQATPQSTKANLLTTQVKI